MFQSLRSRITLAATALAALAFVAASYGILKMVESDLLATTERALAAEVALEAQTIDLASTVRDDFFEFEASGVEYAFGLFLEDPEAGVAFGELLDPVTFDPVADVIIETGPAAGIEIFEPFSEETIDDPELIALIEELAFSFRDVDGDEGNVLLVGAVARDEVDQSLAAVRNALLAIIPVMIVGVAAMIWWLVGRALRPVQAISDQVQAISTTSLDQRVPVPQGTDEIAGLAGVMNGMLSRLEQGDVKQRQFAADASHELRSPLSTVRAAAEMIERNPTSGRAEVLAGDIVAEADRMDALIGDLLALSRIDEASGVAKHELVDLSALVAEFTNVQASVQPQILLRADAAQLQRAIENLINNAQRHANSRVTLDLRVIDHLGQHFAQLCVEDDGAGVPHDQRHVIFERFSRLDEARSREQGGAGLGLSLVQTIAARHRGTIAVDDSPLGGARFTLHLPLS